MSQQYTVKKAPSFNKIHSHHIRVSNNDYIDIVRGHEGAEEEVDIILFALNNPELIAWVRNVLADGHSIAKTPGVSPRATTMYGEVYNGPVEGVTDNG